ncbi:MAG TPA: cyanophycin synthetase [Chloroflexota bacterium]|jgi:dihydrofolate synthase/folylpolyglutamate synthase|nr:cyanophycin synthetase [Chloroflexota bacterium]
MTSPQGPLAWLLGFSDPERGVGWNPRASPDPFWKPGRTRALLDLAGAPDRQLRVVTIAGTNGKGSTGAFLESIAGAAGRRTGVCTQPHLHVFRERVRLDRSPIAEPLFARHVGRLAAVVGRLRARHPEAGEPTTFELTTVLAALAFAEAGVDLAVFDVGIGGRLDPVNALHPSLAIVTSIGLDHTHVLGRSLSAIAAEKAAVMRPGVVALSARQRPTAARVLAREAARLAARLAVVEPLPASGPADRDGQPVTLTYRARTADAKLSLLGPHQRQNAALAARAAEELDLPLDAVLGGLAGVRWPGRLEWVAGQPPLYIDGAHNPDGARALAAGLDELARGSPYALVFGCARDKDAPGLLRPLLGRAVRVWTAAADEARARPPDALAAIIGRLGRRAEPATSVAAALAAARASGAPLVVVAGSLRVVAEAREALGLAPQEEPP